MSWGRPLTNSASVTSPSSSLSSCENKLWAKLDDEEEDDVEDEVEEDDESEEEESTLPMAPIPPPGGGGPPPPWVWLLLSLCACISVDCRVLANCWKAVVRSLSLKLAIEVELDELLVALVVLV